MVNAFAPKRTATFMSLEEEQPPSPFQSHLDQSKHELEGVHAGVQLCPVASQRGHQPDGSALSRSALMMRKVSMTARPSATDARSEYKEVPSSRSLQ